jgi:flagellar hook-associated protein 2
MRPIGGLQQVVTDFVDTYNQLQAIIKSDIDPATGSLSRDSAARTMMTSLSRLTLAPLASGSPAGTPKTLAEIGVATNRDGTLRVDTEKLSKALAAYPDAIEAMFAAGCEASGDGLPAALNAIADQAANKKYGLTASQDTYADALDDLAEQQERIESQAAVMTERLTQQFATMDARVAAYKSTQTFLQSQIDAWNQKD